VEVEVGYHISKIKFNHSLKLKHKIKRKENLRTYNREEEEVGNEE
jgi:hypothetical protein